MISVIFTIVNSTGKMGKLDELKIDFSIHKKLTMINKLTQTCSFTLNRKIYLRRHAEKWRRTNSFIVKALNLIGGFYSPRRLF